MEINTIERVNKAFINKWRSSFAWKLEFLTNAVIDVVSDLRVGRGNSEVVNLTAEQNRYAFDGGMVDVALMHRRLETKFGVFQNDIDVLFPEPRSFRMALESTKNGKDKTTFQANAVSVEIPIGVGIIDSDIRRDGGGR